MQLYNYQVIIHQYIIHARNKMDIFMQCFYSNSLIRLGSFYDQHIEVILSESIHRFNTKDIYIHQKAMFIISYIYQKAIVTENCSYSYTLESFVCYRVIDLVERYVYYISQSYIFEDIYQNLLHSYSFIFIRNLFIYLICLFILYIYFIYYFIYYLFIFIYYYYIVYRKEQSKIRGKSGERTGREYDQISQIIRMKCYL